MIMQGLQTDFFIGAMTPTGFLNFPNDLYDSESGWRAYLIKSGSGTGKSTLMNTLLNHVKQKDLETVLLHCSSDVSSLDGILFPEIKTCILDATFPHNIEPTYWGSSERILNLSEFMDCESLYSRLESIISTQQEKTELFKQFKQFLATAAALLSDNRNIVVRYININKVKKNASKIAKYELNSQSEDAENEKIGHTKTMFLSGITPSGCVTFHSTLQKMCHKIYSLEDEHGVASSVFLNGIKNHFINAGHDIIVCPCPLSPQNKIDHLIVPSLGLGFTTSNSFQKVDFPVFRRIHASRFIDNENFKKRKHLLSFNRRAAKEIVEEAVLIVQDASIVHKRLENMHIGFMDWTGVDKVTTKLLDEFDAIIASYDDKE